MNAKSRKFFLSDECLTDLGYDREALDAMHAEMGQEYDAKVNYQIKERL